MPRRISSANWSASPLPRPPARPAAGERDPRRRERVGVLPVQRLLLPRRPVRRAGSASGHPHDHLSRRARARGGRDFGALDHVVAGSWVYGNLATWIGARDKNRAWDLLCDAKHSFDLVMASGRLSARRSARWRSASSPICEGSDWFWWFGDYNPPESVTSFDRLFRLNLAHLLPPAASCPSPRARPAHQPGRRQRRDGRRHAAGVLNSTARRPGVNGTRSRSSRAVPQS